eukprot:13827894-Heterocapsa_arctica.AAC.1
MHDHVKISRTLHGPARRLGGCCGPAGLPAGGRASGLQGLQRCASAVACCSSKKVSAISCML